MAAMLEAKPSMGAAVATVKKGRPIRELKNRVIPDAMDTLRSCSKVHSDLDCVDYDRHNWEKIQRLRSKLGRDTMDGRCLMTRIIDALNNKDYETASRLQVELLTQVEELVNLYITYKKNLF